MIVKLNEIDAKRVEIDGKFTALCKLCGFLLEDDEYFSYPKVGEIQTRYFYCDDCSEKEDQEISFEKKYRVKSIEIELEEIN